MIGKLYYSSSTSRGTASFKAIPFHSASIDWKREEASTFSFKSPIKLSEGDRVRYESDTRSFGGQIYKITHRTNEDYSYECISYLRLYHDKVTCSYSNLTSSQIMKKVLKLSKNNFSTSGVKDTIGVHSNLKWENTSIWDIALQLCWLEHQAGFEVRTYVNSDGTLVFGYINPQQQGYIFNSAFEYEEEHDSSDIITQYSVNYKGKTIATAKSNNDLLAKWGYVGETSECPTATTSYNSGSVNKTVDNAGSVKDTTQIKKYKIPSTLVTKAVSLVNPKDTPTQRLKKIYKWVLVNVSYVYYKNTKHGALGTYKQRSGNCCDHTHLTIAMARAVGIKCRYVNRTKHVHGEYKLNGKWFVCDNGCGRNSGHWGGYWSGAGGVKGRYDVLPF